MQSLTEPRAGQAADLVEFLAYSGLRLGEAREVCWRDVNFSRETLLVTGGVERKTTKPEPSPFSFHSKTFCFDSKKKYDLRTDDKIFHIDSAKKAIATACQNVGLPHYGTTP